MHPTQRVVLLGNISAPSNSVGTRTVCGIVLERNSERPCKLTGQCLGLQCITSQTDALLFGVISNDLERP